MQKVSNTFDEDDRPQENNLVLTISSSIFSPDINAFDTAHIVAISNFFKAAAFSASVPFCIRLRCVVSAADNVLLPLAAAFAESRVSALNVESTAAWTSHLHSGSTSIRPLFANAF